MRPFAPLFCLDLERPTSIPFDHFPSRVIALEGWLRPLGDGLQSLLPSALGLEK